MKVATPMLAVFVMLLPANAELAAVEIGADGETGWIGYILLQTKNFLTRADKHIDGLDAAAPTTAECPGAPVEENAKPAECFYVGVSIVVKDGSSIQSFFDDNVEMKEFNFYLDGAQEAPIASVEAHPFQVGTTRVIVEGHDLAGNKRRCHRTVTIADTQKPKFTKSPDSVEKSLTMFVDDSCQKTATAAFAKYEESSGFVASGSDNCGVDGVTKVVRKGGDVLYDDASETGDILDGPGTYELVYTLTDIYHHITKHTVVLELKDDTPPFNTEGCPADAEGEPIIFVEVDAAETTGHAEWALPKVIKDNCLGHGTLPPPLEANGQGSAPVWNNETQWYTSSGNFAVGDHQMSYPIIDAHGNLFPHECKFTITVKQKAHPVAITCPEDVVTQTVELAEFGVPMWSSPVVMQGGKLLTGEHISYHNGAGPGLPFIYGATLVTVTAHGAVTGTRTHEEEQTDECTFMVTVQDPERPYVDGRHFRCEAESLAGSVEPYGVCEGSDLKVALHTGYENTGGYDLVAGLARAHSGCCSDQQGTEYSCQASPSPLFKYCKPGHSTEAASHGGDGAKPEEHATQAEHDTALHDHDGDGVADHTHDEHTEVAGDHEHTEGKQGVEAEAAAGDEAEEAAAPDEEAEEAAPAEEAEEAAPAEEAEEAAPAEEAEEAAPADEAEEAAPAEEAEEAAPAEEAEEAVPIKKEPNPAEEAASPGEEEEMAEEEAATPEETPAEEFAPPKK